MYVLKGGEVVEQGYRVDLEAPSQAGEIESEFRRMMSAQGDGFPVRDDDEIEELGRYDYNLPEIFSWPKSSELHSFWPRDRIP